MTSGFSVNELKERYVGLMVRIHNTCARAKRDPSSVTLIAVSKGQDADAIDALYRLGHRDFGENYVQEMINKAEDLEKRGCTGIRWHFIGHLQSNKAKAVISKAASIHSIDSEKIALEISKRLDGQTIPIFIEVNISKQPSKTGLMPEDMAVIARNISDLPGIEIQGLMCIPDPEKGSEATRLRFRQLAKLEKDLGSISRRKLSMGMSSDFETAIAEGATHIRVGTAIFGDRKK